MKIYQTPRRLARHIRNYFARGNGNRVDLPRITSSLSGVAFYCKVLHIEKLYAILWP
jgi:hypothetical protein